MKDKKILTTILEALQVKVSSQVFRTYFKDITIISIDSKTLTIGCKNSFIKTILENKYLPTLNEMAQKILNNNLIKVQIVVNVKNSESHLYNDFPKDDKKEANLFLNNNFKIDTTNEENKSEVDTKINFSRLNPKYTFSNFVVGSNNQLAHAAALAIVENPGKAYNPFFVYGDVGLGKTHLIQAIGNAIIQKNPEYKVLYCSTESFLNEMIQSIIQKNIAIFREKYRDLDVLILDDIHFISKKEGLQEEFFNTFNTLYQAGRQIIVASDRPPSEISHLENRIRSRFEGGLVADIQKPDLETRVAILQNKLNERNEDLPSNIIYKIAELVDSNIRELEGALLKVSIFAKVHNWNISVNDIIQLLDRGSSVISKRKKINPLEIINAVSEELQISVKDIKSPKRHQEIVYARQICMFLLKEILNLQLIKIAKHLGRKDHTTIIHGISKIENLRNTDKDTAKLIQQIKSKINY